MKRLTLSSRGLMITMLVLFGLCFLQATYWVVDQMGYARTVHSGVVELLDREVKWAKSALEGEKLAVWADEHPYWMIQDGVFSLDQGALDRMDRQLQSRINRYRWEGAFFLFVLGLGIFVLIRTLRQHERLLKRQSNFLASVGHELKSPLASLQLSAETLEIRNCEPEQVQRLSARMQGDVARLTTFVNNILETSRLDTGQRTLRRDTVNLHGVLNGVVEQNRTRYADQAIEWDSTAQGIWTLNADPMGVQMVLQNLVDNACKSVQASGGGVVRVSLVQGKSTLTAIVQDDGLGFEPGERERMFQRFYRVGDELTRKTKGSGLGLYIARAAIELEGGRLQAESPGPGKGATFRAEWPMPHIVEGAA